MSNGGGSDFLTVALLLFAGYCVLYWIAQLLVLAALGVYILILFVAFALSVLSLLAWNRRLRLGRLTLGPEEGRPFVVRGLLGAVLVPAFAALCEMAFQIGFPAKLWPHFALGGYALGAVGGGWLDVQAGEPDTDRYTVIEHEPAPALPHPPDRVRPAPRRHEAPPEDTPARACRCFTFASWDDEAEGDAEQEAKTGERPRHVL